MKLLPIWVNNQMLFFEFPAITASSLVFAFATHSDLIAVFARSPLRLDDTWIFGNRIAIHIHLNDRLRIFLTDSLAACTISAVVDMRHPFQILGHVVALVLVLVVNLRKVVRVRNESLCHQSMNLRRCCLAIHWKQPHLIVTALTNFRLQHSRLDGVWCNGSVSRASHDSTTQRPHPSQVANLVQAFKTFDVFPNLIHLLSPVVQSPTMAQSKSVSP